MATVMWGEGGAKHALGITGESRQHHGWGSGEARA